MANVKIPQKISLPEFKVMMEQKKNAQLHVVLGSCLPITKDRILGRVVSMFNIGRKVDVNMELYNLAKSENNSKPVGGVFRFEVLDGVYYLVKQDD